MGERIVDRWQIVVHQRWGIPLRALRCAACALASFGNRTRVHPHDSRRYPTTNGGLFEASSFSVSLSDALVSITFCGSLTADFRKWRLTAPERETQKKSYSQESASADIAGRVIGWASASKTRKCLGRQCGDGESGFVGYAGQYADFESERHKVRQGYRRSE